MKNRKITTEKALAIIASGGMIIMTDEENRENEGDLVGAARFADPAMVNFMATHGRGLICCALEEELCRRAGLEPLDKGTSHGLHETNFCTPVDLIAGCTTGISAADRSATLKRLVSPQCQPKDFARPGHIFTLREAPGGLSVRQGHTEASVELCRQAGLEGAAVICEIMDEDGTMARWDKLNQLAEEWDLGILTISDFRKGRERQKNLLPQPVRLPTKWGRFSLDFPEQTAREGHTGGDPVCLIRLPDSPDHAPHPEGPLVRIHSECLTGDLFGSTRCDCGDQLREAQKRIEEEGEGYLIYLRQEGRGIGLKAKAAAYHLQDRGLDTVEANLELGFAEDSRTYQTAVDYLKSKGVEKLRLLTNNPDKVTQLEREGLTVVRVPLIIEAKEENRRYMEVKQNKMGHWSA
ncbi:MAG: GTP cyclohydrolase II [Spirochaetales bacterium]|nr:GTP cyclohydrolase II [Spirochaetales bacterium]